MILGVPSAVSRTLAGFRSRWTMPWLVGGVHGPRQRLDQPAASCGGSGVPSSLLVEAAAVDELQREEGQAVVLADLVDLHDVRVLQAGDGLGLGPEAGQLLGAGVVAGQDHLQGDDAVERELPGLVDDAHAAAAQLAQDFVAGHKDGGPDSGGGQVARLIDCLRAGDVPERR